MTEKLPFVGTFAGWAALTAFGLYVQQVDTDVLAFMGSVFVTCIVVAARLLGDGGVPLLSRVYRSRVRWCKKNARLNASTLFAMGFAIGIVAGLSTIIWIGLGLAFHYTPMFWAGWLACGVGFLVTICTSFIVTKMTAESLECSPKSDPSAMKV